MKLYFLFIKFFNKISHAEAKLNEAEKELEGGRLDDNLKEMRATLFNQQKLLEQYSLELAAQEYQFSVIVRNLKSLDDDLSYRCFRRTRLEP